MNEQQTSYRQIFKATSLFGGVQLITILIGIVKTKFVAVFLGTTGVGILGLFNAPIGLITSITSLGISYSAIRSISEAHSSGNSELLARIITTFRRWVLFTGCMGMIATIVLSKWLSVWTFGDTTYTWSFIILSLTLFINDLSAGQRALLQGMRKLQSMAKATIIGAIIGLITSIPIFYYYGISGIVPSLVISAFSALILTWYFARQVHVDKAAISYQESFIEGMGMIKFGILLSISIQIGALATYLINAYISLTGGLEQVGLYSAGMTLVITSVGLIFNAMGMDYYPKLATVNKDNVKIKAMANQQVLMSVLIILPLIICLLSTMPLIIQVMLSKAFTKVIPFVNLSVLSVLIKAVCFPIGYISFVKGDSKVYFWLEGIFSNILNLILSIFFYHFWGLVGIGISIIIYYAIYLLLVYKITNKRYNFSFDKGLYPVFVFSFLLIITAFLSITYLSSFPLYFTLVILIITGFIYSLYHLNKLMNFKPVLIDSLNKVFKR